MNSGTNMHVQPAAVMPQTFLARVASRLALFTSREKWFNSFGVVIAIASFLLGLITYFLLTDDIRLSDKLGGFYWLLGIDIILVLALGYVVVSRASDVWKKRNRQMAGAQLHIQLMGVFSALVTIPTLLVAVFAIAFIHFGVQSWFGENIKTAVNESQEVAQAYLQEHQQSIRADMLAMANDLNREAPRLMNNKDGLEEFFQTQAYLRNLSEAVLLDGSGNILARAGITFSLEFLPQNFDQMIERAKNGEVILFMGGNEDRVRALVKMDNYVDTYLFVGRFVDENVLTRISSTTKAVNVYKALEARQKALKVNMTLVFLLVAVMLLLVAIWLGLKLAERIVMPVSRLIQAAERIRAGDLNARVDVDNRESEMTTLARAFNRMTDQLSAQRRDLVNANKQLDERRRFSEAVLGGVNAGIIGMDGKGVIQIVNASAQKLLMQDSMAMIGKKLAEVCPDMEKVRRVLRSKGGASVETPIDVNIPGQMTQSHWIVRMTAEGEGEELRGYVATFDDLSPLIEAQRKAAWSDVARRVAHEIKNPLTPIQLSAERLKRRYAKQITDDPETFEICTDTIVRHVDDIRHMVDEFSAFARMPQANKRPENLVTICQQVLVLFQQGHTGAKFHFNRPENPIRVMMDRQQITQAITNLVKNAFEAVQEQKEKTGDDFMPQVTLAIQETEKNVILNITDNGMGWPADLLPRLTDPYVTTKSTGTGLGLSIVAKIVEDHDGKLEFLNNVPNGAMVRVTFPKGEIQNG